MEKKKGLIKSWDVSFEVKTVDEEQRIIEGWASTNEVDRVGDIVEPSAFKKTLKRFKEIGNLLYNHMLTAPVGKILEAKVVPDKGLWIKAEIGQGFQPAEDVWKMISQGILKAFSIGFIPKKIEYNEEEKGNWNRKIVDLELLEVSVVTVPACATAVFTMLGDKMIEIEPDYDFETTNGDTPNDNKDDGSDDMEEKRVVPFQDLPLADRNLRWDKDSAESAVRKWASKDGSGEKDKMDWAKYRKAFVWYDESEPENFTSYKLLIANVFDGELKAVPRGIFAAAVVVQGGRGGLNVPKDDIPKIKTHLGKYYKKMGLEPPWKRKEMDIELLALVDDLEGKMTEIVNEVENKFAAMNDKIKLLFEDITKLKEINDNKSTTDDSEDKELEEFLSSLVTMVREVTNTKQGGDE